MHNQDTGFKVVVHLLLGSGPYISIPPQQVERVHQLLTEHGIGHTLPEPTSGSEDGGEVSIQVGRMYDVERIQDILESVQ